MGWLRDEYPDWHVEMTELPDGIGGGLKREHRVIWIDDRLTQADRRWVLTHEIVHLERGDDGPCDLAVEESINIEAAPRLIDLEELIGAAQWARSAAELAAELWVPPRAVRVRVRHLHPSERAEVRRRVGRLDGRV